MRTPRIVRRAAAVLCLLAPAGCGKGPGAADTCSLAPPVLPSPQLHAEGTTLRDALGRVVILRGVDAGGRSKFAPFAPFDFTASDYDTALGAYLDRAASWGANALRVPFVWAAVEPTQGTYDADFLSRYDALVDGAWARGMYTVVDFHQDVYSDAFCGDGFPDWTLQSPPAPMTDCPSWGTEYLSDVPMQKAFDAFWASGSPVRAAYDKLWTMMATRYASHPGVIGFEPFNEPGWGTANQTTWEATTLTTFYGDMAASLHAAAPNALLFFDATGTDAVTLTTSMTLPSGAGIVFAPHYYQYAALGNGTPNADRVFSDLHQWQELGKTWNVPVLLGEFGADNGTPGVTDYLTAHFDALDKLGISGTQWEYSVSAELWNEENLSLCAADGTENPMAAAILRPYPRAVSGDAVSFSYDASSRAASLRYTPAPGISEVAVPARAYPSGYSVQVTGGCADTSQPGRLLVQASPGATAVEVQITSR